MKQWNIWANRQTDRLDNLTDWGVKSILILLCFDWVGRFSNLFDILCGSLIFLKNYEKYLIFVSIASYTLPSNI